MTSTSREQCVHADGEVHDYALCPLVDDLARRLAFGAPMLVSHDGVSGTAGMNVGGVMAVLAVRWLLNLCDEQLTVAAG